MKALISGNAYPCPTNSISGVRLNGCYICCHYCNVWHPKDGFFRGGDGLYKTVQDICDINHNNAIPDRENHLPMLKQVSGSRELKKEGEYISEQVDDASLYATEALKFYVQNSHYNYELVKPGFGTRVLLPKCTLFHVNFQAKETVPVAPEKLFFAELTSSAGVLSVKCCFPLSLSELESGDETGDKTNGCYYCHEFNKVRHPMFGGFVRGGDSLYVSEKEFWC
ncbi:hypothetical protein OROMI_010338 [Orobanche minor]